MTNHSTTRKLKGKQEEIPKIEGRAGPGDIKHEPGVLEFLIEFYYAEDELQGKITHCMTNKKDRFSGLDQAKIIHFMKPYLSRAESARQEPVEESSQAIQASAEEQEKKVNEIPPNEMRTRSYGVIAAGTTQTTGLLQQGQPFKVQWSFEPPSIPGMESEQMDYKIVIYRKEVPGGANYAVGKKDGQKKFSEPLTASFECESLPPGMYRLEGNSLFSIKKREWRSICHETNLVEVI